MKAVGVRNLEGGLSGKEPEETAGEHKHGAFWESQGWDSIAAV